MQSDHTLAQSNTVRLQFLHLLLPSIFVVWKLLTIFYNLPFAFFPFGNSINFRLIIIFPQNFIIVQESSTEECPTNFNTGCGEDDEGDEADNCQPPPGRGHQQPLAASQTAKDAQAVIGVGGGVVHFKLGNSIGHLKLKVCTVLYKNK